MANEAPRAVAYLKEYVTECLERLHDGSLNQPQASLLLWSEIENVFRKASREPYQKLGRLRVEVTQAADCVEVFEAVEAVGAATVFSARLLPPPAPPPEIPQEEVGRLREEGLLPTTSVLYVDVDGTSATGTARIVAGLEKVGYNVTRWSYGY